MLQQKKEKIAMISEVQQTEKKIQSKIDSQQKSEQTNSKMNENKQHIIKMNISNSSQAKSEIPEGEEEFLKVYRVVKGKVPATEPKPFDKQKLTKVRRSMIKVEEVTRMRIPSDEILAKDEDSLVLSQSVTCPICLMILQLPYYECQGCSNGFCTICLESWWKKAPKSCAFKCSNVQFKQVKRSNTYNAVMSMLKVKCKYCRQQYTIADISTHLIKHCPQVPQFCRFCEIKLPRKSIESHEKQVCEERQWKCQYCELDYIHRQRTSHDELCKQKLFPCTNADCLQKIRRKDLESHEQNCDFNVMHCSWCETKMNQKQCRLHMETCPQKKIKCAWCSKICSVTESYQHELTCEFKKEGCRLCHEMILSNSMSQHKIDCMFDNMIEMKNKSQTLQIENVRLKEKIMMLEGILEETIANNKSSAMKAVSDLREQDKKVIQKDLLRLDNSIRSVEKLKKQEVNTHMKFPHLIQSWCPICRQLDKKFKAMLQPLFQQRKQVLVRLNQLQRFSLTPQ